MIPIDMLEAEMRDRIATYREALIKTALERDEARAERDTLRVERNKIRTLVEQTQPLAAALIVERDALIAERDALLAWQDAVPMDDLRCIAREEQLQSWHEIKALNAWLNGIDGAP